MTTLLSNTNSTLMLNDNIVAEFMNFIFHHEIDSVVDNNVPEKVYYKEKFVKRDKLSGLNLKRKVSAHV